MFDDGFVGHATDAGEGGDGAVGGFGGEIAEGEHFVFRETSGAELLIGAIEQVLGRRVVADAADVVEALEHPAVNGGCGFAVELLVDDALDEGFERRLCACNSHRERAGAFDESPKFRIGGGEFATGESGVVAWRAWAIDRARHSFDGIREAGNRQWGVDNAARG